MSIDKAGWGQVAVGVLSALLSIGAGWVAISSVQAEQNVKIVQMQDRLDKGDAYDAFLQEQVDRNEERIIITETTIKYLKENFGEMNSNMKLLVKEVQELNKNMAVLAAEKERG